MYIAVTSISIDLHSPLPNRDTILFQLSIAFKKLSFDCLNESLNSRRKEAYSFGSLKSSLLCCAPGIFGNGWASYPGKSNIC